MDECGIRKTKVDGQYDEKELKFGTGIEMEHTTNPSLAKTIAKHHLDEHPDYYKELRKMEAKLEKRLNSKKRRQK